MKRLAALFLALVLLLSVIPAALADSPDPIPVIAKEDLSPTPAGMHHYMLICLDSWEGDLSKHAQHTDGMILVTVDEYGQRVMLTSFIRDMLIQRPDGKFGRINNIVDMCSPQVKGGIDGETGIRMLVDTINSHFDLQIEKFIVVDFKQVENIIDAVGGVDITVTAREASYLRNYSISSTSTTPSMAGAGTYHFSGHAAVIYMRIRKRETAPYVHADGNTYSDTQDYGRTYRDRMVLSSIADSLKDITPEDAMRLLDVVIANTVYTNMSVNDLREALDLALQMRGVPVEHIRMPVNNPSKQNSSGEWYEVSPTPENYRRGGYSYCEFAFDGMATKQVNFLLNREALHSFLMDSFVVVDEE